MNENVDISSLKEEIIRLRIELVRVRKEISLPKMRLRELLKKTINEIEFLLADLNNI